MPTRLRQVALAAADLSCVPLLCDVLGVEVAHRDPSVGIFGLENAVLALGEGGFLEVVAPVQPNTTVGRLLEKHGGRTCGYMAIFQTDDLEAARRSAAAAGQHVVWEVDLGPEAATFHLHPRQLGAVVSFDRMRTWDDWLWAGPAWRNHGGEGEVTGLIGVTVSVPNAEEAAAKWRGLLGDEAGTVAVVPGALPGGLTAFTLRASVSPAVFQSRAREAGLPVSERGIYLGDVEILFAQ
jgi:hypothetical protein